MVRRYRGKNTQILLEGAYSTDSNVAVSWPLFILSSKPTSRYGLRRNEMCLHDALDINVTVASFGTIKSSKPTQKAAN